MGKPTMNQDVSLAKLDVVHSPTTFVFVPGRSGTRLDTRLVAFGAFAGYAGVRMTQRLFKRGVLSNEKKPTKLH